MDARLRVHHPCPYCDISVRFPDSLLLLWCDNRRDLFLVSSPAEEELDTVVRSLRRSFHGEVLLREGRDALIVLPEFEWSEPPSVTGIARREGVFVVPPVVYSDGRETYRVLSPTRARLRRFIHRLRRLGDVELLSVVGRTDLATVREPPLGTVHFLEGLTDRQVRSLVRGFEEGLVRVPAKGRWESAARREGLSRSTFGEHLRKGQWRLLANAYPALRARVEPPAPPVLLRKLRPARRARGPRARDPSDL
ncbi:MAG TPA: hypothetical protein VLX64_01795 [Thermoplasmata archaeon]|nr:hypothetical protein [Thermoplasmata archaeon]HUJ77719.1 hypothetical protein [Thermoplasmata archaeon]